MSAPAYPSETDPTYVRPMASTLDLVAARGEFSPRGVYLNTASLGLPPRRALAALEREIERWRLGLAEPPGYDTAVNSARNGYAELVGATPSTVAVGSQVSVFAGVVAASLEAGTEVLTAQGEFTSIVFPFLVQRDRGVTVREVPLEQLTDAISARTSLVVVSAAQSADGRLVDLDALADAAGTHDAQVFLDTTQAAGWLPLDADRFTYTSCSGYKWLLAPRGTCFFTVQPEAMDGLAPHAAGWYAGESPWHSIYGSPLRLAQDARRFDISPAWLSWVAQAQSLELLNEVGVTALHAHSVGLANDFRAGVGLDASNSAIVSLTIDEDARGRLSDSGIAASMRDGRLRLSFHLCNGDDDVNQAVDALRPR